MTSNLVRGALGLAVLLPLAGCDGVFGPDGPPPPARLHPAPLVSTAAVGEALTVRVTVQDESGDPVRGETVTWTVTGGGGIVDPVESTSGSGGAASTTWALGTAPGRQSITATVRDLEREFAVTTEAGPAALLTITPEAAVLESLGETLELDAVLMDGYGNAADRTGLQWSSSDPQVAEVTSEGVVIAHAEGEVDITAALGDLAASVPVRVDQVVAGLEIDLWTTVLARGESFDLVAVPVDAGGTAVDTLIDAQWSSSDATVASVTADGHLEAVDAGLATVTASAPPFTRELELDVRQGPRPAIAAISPATLRAGAQATITGSGFSTAGQNEVRVAGVPVTVTGSSGSQLTVTLPDASSFPCLPTGPRDVLVLVDGLGAVARHPVAGAAAADLAVGGAVTLGAAEIGCSELVTGGSYLVTVFNATPIAAAATGFELRGSGGGSATTSSLRASALRTPSIRVQPGPRPDRSDTDPEVRGHLRMMDRNRELLERLGHPDASVRAGTARALASATVGAIRTFRVPDLDEGSLCSNYHTVTARAVYSGQRGVIWEDTLAPLAGSMDPRWREVGQEFDGVMYPVLLEHFGDPLTYDSRLDADGQFNMLFSETVNDMDAGVAGFVFSGDFFTRHQCASSDQGEIFYGRVPTDSGSGYDGNTVDSWLWGIRSTVIHEVKHITSFAHKIRDAGPQGANYEEQWLEESTARLAEEFYARALFGYRQHDNVDYGSSIYGEIRVGSNWPEYDQLPSIMVKHFGGASDYLKAMESLSLVGRVGEDDWSFYGSGWLFVRWAIDQSGLPESQFVRALIDEDGVTGVDNIEARTGRSFRDLLGDFSLALAADDHPDGFAPLDPTHSHTGWNTRDIFAGLHDDYADTSLSDRFDRPWPIRAHALPAGGFNAVVPSLQGGTTTVFELTVPPGATQLLQVLGSGGGTAPSSLGMSIVRVQ